MKPEDKIVLVGYENSDGEVTWSIVDPDGSRPVEEIVKSQWEHLEELKTRETRHIMEAVVTREFRLESVVTIEERGKGPMANPVVQVNEKQCCGGHA